MALVIGGTERQTISLGGVEFKNLGGGGVNLNVLAYPSLSLSNSLSAQK
jgi:hypothetical protein